MRKVDLHVHTVHSDGQLTVAEVARAAKHENVLCGVCDHLSPYHFMYDEAAFDAYVADVGRHGLLCGAEYCIGAEIPVGPDRLARLDYLTAGLHAVTVAGRKYFFWGEDLPADAAAFAAACVAAAEAALPVNKPDILAHPTFLPPPLQDRYDDLWTRELLTRLFEAVLASGVALEISGRWLVPRPGALKLAAEMGLTFAVGSDAHRRDQLFNVEYPRAMINALGIPEERLFLPAAARR